METYERIKARRKELGLSAEIVITPEFMPREIRGADLEQCRILGVPWLLLRQEK